MPRPSIACDTTVLLYLGRMGRVDLIASLFEPVLVPEPVMLELDMGRLIRPETIDPRTLDWIQSVAVPQSMVDALPPNRLGAGERAVIAVAHSRACVAGLDDLQALSMAETMRLQVAGTLGILLRAHKAGLLDAVKPLLDAAIAQGFRVGAGLYRDVLELAGETL